jgi:Ca2+-binding RTX toxin-like protein
LAFTTVRSATGVDFIGTSGVDVGVFFNETGAVVATGLGDADVITFNNSDGIQRTTSVQGGGGNDQITFLSSVSEASVNGNLGADIIRIFGSTANSFIGGGDGADFIDGGTQFLSSEITGGKGADRIDIAENLALATINGGEGNDTINLDTFAGTQVFNNASINGNAGNDTINALNLDVSLSGTNFIGAGSGDDTLDFRGATTDAGAAATGTGFSLNGGSGNDLMLGSTEDDTLSGGSGNDTITGFLGEDVILAGAGNDIITAANDVITGGSGADTYNFGAGTSTFRIEAVANSEAATSGTAFTFDNFVPYGNFLAGDRLNISAVSNTLAGGALVGGLSLANLGNRGAFADFGALKANLDAGAFGPSTTAGIQSFTFTATINGTAASFLWVQDSQSAYTSSDLLFRTSNVAQIGAANIVVA